MPKSLCMQIARCESEIAEARSQQGGIERVIWEADWEAEKHILLAGLNPGESVSGEGGAHA